MAETGRGYAVGSQIFVDLWSLLGLVPLPCESPGESASVFVALAREKAAFVAVEKEWFEGLQEPVRRRLEKSDDPVWIQFPSCESGEMR
jgi:vacuolar-type H+-ATPase subunit F/Vma7